MNQIEITNEQKNEMLEFYRNELSLSALIFVCLGFLLLAVLYVSTLGLQASSIFIYVLFRIFNATLIFEGVMLLKILLCSIDYLIVSVNKFRVVKTRKHRMFFRNIKRKQINLNQNEHIIYARIGIGKYYLLH